MGVDVAEAVGDGFLHRALLYRGAAEFRASIERYLRGGQARAEPVLIATAPVKVSWLRRELNGDTAGVAFTDMTELGRNPARIIPAVRAFMDRYPGRRIRCVGEPVWADRSAAELREATRYEALVNTAFGGSPATMVCLYDSRGTHLVGAGRRRLHPSGRAPPRIGGGAESGLPRPGGAAAQL